jgi:integrase
MPKRKTDRDGLYRRSDSPFWWASYTDAAGTRIRRSTGTDSRHEAEAMLAQWKVHTHKERCSGKEPERRLHELVMAYIDAHPEKRSLERDSYSTKHLYRLLGAQRVLNAMAKADVHGYIRVRRAEGVNAGTINRELALLSAAINWGKRALGWDIPNLLVGQRQQVPPGRDRWLTLDEAARLVRAAGSGRSAASLVDFILLGLHTGMRTGEILGLEWARVDLNQGWVTLESHHQKSGKVSRIPLNRTAREALLSRARFRAAHCPGSPWVFCNR